MSDLLIEVISSWQVIFVTIALVLYMFIVFYVAKAYRRPIVNPIKIRKKAKPVEVEGPEEVVEGSEDSNEDLGLEEE